MNNLLSMKLMIKITTDHIATSSEANTVHVKMTVLTWQSFLVYM